jgi:hypothetical protein
MNKLLKHLMKQARVLHVQNAHWSEHLRLQQVASA